MIAFTFILNAFVFTGFDGVVLLVLVLSGLVSLKRGFMHEISSIIALCVAIIGSLYAFGHYQSSLHSLINPKWLADGMLFGGVFILLYMVTHFILRRWAHLLTAEGAGVFNKLGGFVFGILRGFIFVSLAVMILTRSLSVEDNPPDFIMKASFYPAISVISKGLESLPFLQARDLAADIVREGRNSEVLPDISDTLKTKNTNQTTEKTPSNE